MEDGLNEEEEKEGKKEKKEKKMGTLVYKIESVRCSA